MDRVAAILDSISTGTPAIGEIEAEFGSAMRAAAARVFNAYNPRVDEAIGGTSVADVVEDILVELYERGMPKTLTRNRLRKYLITAARNRAVDALRRARFDQPLPRDPEGIGLMRATTGVLRIPLCNKRQTG